MPKRKCSSVNLSVGNRLKKYRDACSLTQQQVADILNINRTTYTKYETGVSEPSHDILKKIVSIFGIDFNAILGDKDTFESNVFDYKMPMYNLTKDEQDLIGRYRLLSNDEKAEFSKIMNEIISNRNTSNNND